MPADDLTDPAPATTFAHLDATTVLSRGVAERGIYPAVDPLDSTSRIMDPNVIGAEHYGVARDVQKLLQDYKSLQDIIAILGMDELSEEVGYQLKPFQWSWLILLILGQDQGRQGEEGREVPVPALPGLRDSNIVSEHLKSYLADFYHFLPGC